MESFDPFCEWLGRPSDRRPQNHYELLGLALFESDLDLISHTADTLRAKIRKIRPGSRLAEWQRLLDRLEAAKICLSDPIAKAAYDESIDTTSHTLHVSDGPVVTGSSSGEKLDSFSAVEDGGEGSAGPDHAGVASPSPQFIEAPPVAGERGQDGSSGLPPSDVALLPSVRPVGRKSFGYQLAIRVLGATTVLLLIAIGLMALKGRRDAVQTAASPRQSSNTTPPVEAARPMENPRPTEPPVVPPRDPSRVEGAPTPPSPAASIGAASPPERASAASVPSTAGTIATPGPPVDPARQQAFRRAVASARAGLAERDVEAAATHLNEAVSFAQTEDETAEAEQVEVLRAHVNAYWGSLQELIPKLESGSEIRVGEMMVVVVEAGADFVTLRIAGQNRRYSILGLPHALAAAMGEQLFSKSSNANALRAAFLIAEPDGRAEKAQELLQEASQGGEEVSELLAELNRLE